jgi:hypothetical protein
MQPFWALARASGSFWRLDKLDSRHYLESQRRIAAVLFAQ